MLNENVKQNIVNSMGREDLNGCTIQDLWQTFSWTYLAIFTVKHLCWTLVLTKLETFRPATLLKWESNANVSQWILPNFYEHIYFAEHLQATASEEKKKSTD